MKSQNIFKNFFLGTLGNERVKTTIMTKYFAAMIKISFSKIIKWPGELQMLYEKRHKIVNTLIQIIKILCLKRGKKKKKYNA